MIGRKGITGCRRATEITEAMVETRTIFFYKRKRVSYFTVDFVLKSTQILIKRWKKIWVLLEISLVLLSEFRVIYAEKSRVKIMSYRLRGVDLLFKTIRPVIGDDRRCEGRTSSAEVRAGGAQLRCAYLNSSTTVQYTVLYVYYS